MKSLPFGVLMLLSLLISAAVSFGITPIVKRMAYKVGAVDVPKDARRMHSVPIPRLGGLAMIFYPLAHWMHEKEGKWWPWPKHKKKK